MRRMRGKKKMDTRCCCDDDSTKWVWGWRGCRPQEQIDAPRGSAAETEGGGPDRTKAVIPCYDLRREEESELSNCIEGGPLGIYRVHRTPQTLDYRK